MRIEIACKCGKKLSVEDKYVGKRVSCPGCGQQHLVVSHKTFSISPDLDEPSAPIANAPVSDASLGKHGGTVVLICIGVLILFGSAIGWGIYVATREPERPAAPSGLLHDKLAHRQKAKVTEETKTEPSNKTKDAQTSSKDPKQSTNSSGDPTPKKVDKDDSQGGTVRLRFRPEDGKKSDVPLEVADADKAQIPYRVRRIKPAPTPTERKRLRLAVTPAVYDNMGRLLDQLGDGYRYKGITNLQLGSLSELRKYDVVFLTCSPTELTPLADDKSTEEDRKKREEQRERELKKTLEEMERQAKQNNVPFDREKTLETLQQSQGNSPDAPAVIRQFVEEGGTLYASDLRYNQVLSAFPEVNPNPKQQGGGIGDLFVPVGEFEAQVVDPGLRQYLGEDKIKLNFAPLASLGWRPAVFTDKVSILPRGSPRSLSSIPKIPLLFELPKIGLPQVKDFPLLAKFQSKKGTVIFTSFHNEAQNSDIEKKLLEYLIFSLVNANTEMRLKQIMSADFAVEDLQQVSFSKEKGPPTKTYAHKGGPLQVAVGFENVAAAKFRLTLKSPQGVVITHEEPGLYLIEVPNAPAGNWEYTVMAVTLPYDNFPVMIGIGRGK